MNRRQVLLVAAILGLVLLLYALGFGPLLFVVITAHAHGLAPEWIDRPLEIVFLPHIWLMYHQEWYFSYITWYAERAGMQTGFGWQDFRTHHSGTFAP